MEDNIQTVVGIIISVFIFFIFPVYMAYEKIDDVSYVLAMRYTQEFVDNVRNRGYITKDMYDTFKSKLRATGNSYDIELTHRKARIDPIAQYYGADGKLDYTTTQEDNDGTGVNTYLYEEEVYTTRDIEAILNRDNKLWLAATSSNFTCVDNPSQVDLASSHKKVLCQQAYIMNENDNFNVAVRNTNTTVATAIYNMITANTVDHNARIYVNYGGTILTEKWFGKVDYAKMKHDSVNLEQKVRYHIFTGPKEYNGTNRLETVTGFVNSGVEFSVEFEAKPLKITEIREVGYMPTKGELYNFAVGTRATKAGIQVSIGLNGVVIISSNDREIILSCPMHIDEYKKFRIELVKTPNYHKVILYIDDIKIDESKEFTADVTQITRYGGGHLSGQQEYYFTGYIRNMYLYK